MKIFLIIYTIFYILLEIAFRARLLDVIGSVSNQTTIESIEIIGRLISSFGFSILIISKISFGKTKNQIILSKIALYFISFTLFFYAQKEFVEQISYRLSQETKDKSVYLTIYKENLFFGKLNHKDFPYNSNNREKLESKIFLSNLPLLNLYNIPYIDYLKENKKALIIQNMESKIKIADRRMSKYEYKEASLFLNSIFNNYNNAIGSKKSEDYMIEEATIKGKYIFSGLQTTIENEYSRYRNNINKLLTDYNSSDDLLYKSFNRNTDLVEYFGSNKTIKSDGYIKKSTFANVDFDRYITGDVKKLNNEIQNIINKEYSFDYMLVDFGKKDIGYEYKKSDQDMFEKRISNVSKKVCQSESNYSPKSKIEEDVIYKYQKNKENLALLLSGKNNNRKIIKHFPYKNEEINSKFYICDLENLTNELNYISYDMAMFLNKYVYKFGKDISNYKEFYNTAYKRIIVKNELKKINMFVPDDFNSNNSSEFAKYYKPSLKITLQKNINIKISSFLNLNYKDFIEKYGNFPLNLNEKEFYSHPAIKQWVKNDIPAMIDKNDFVMVYYKDANLFNGIYPNEKKYIEVFIERKEYAKANMIFKLMNEEIKNERIKDTYAKSIIVPPFVLFVSTIMIIFNIINLFTMFFNVKNKTYYNLSLFLLFILIPILIPNDYSKYYDKIENDKNIYTVYATKWLQNSNIIFEHLGVFNNEINIFIDFIELRLLFETGVIDNGAESNFIKYNKSSKLRSYFN